MSIIGWGVIVVLAVILLYTNKVRSFGGFVVFALSLLLYGVLIWAVNSIGLLPSPWPAVIWSCLAVLSHVAMFVAFYRRKGESVWAMTNGLVGMLSTVNLAHHVLGLSFAAALCASIGLFLACMTAYVIIIFKIEK